MIIGCFVGWLCGRYRLHQLIGQCKIKQIDEYKIKWRSQQKFQFMVKYLYVGLQSPRGISNMRSRIIRDGFNNDHPRSWQPLLWFKTELNAVASSTLWGKHVTGKFTMVRQSEWSDSIFAQPAWKNCNILLSKLHKCMRRYIGNILTLEISIVSGNQSSQKMKHVIH